ncbi:MAG TPA: MFS transporter [Dehalococcoidia bacterium]|nr:MFS transporter [Dehalococcoidia bacterium]
MARSHDCHLVWTCCGCRPAFATGLFSVACVGGGAEKRDHHQRFAACIGICRCADTRGLLIAATATHIGFFVAAGGWIAMLIATLFLPRRGSSPEQRSVIRELATGFRFIRGHRVLLMLMGFGWIGLLPAYVDQLGGGAREVGFVFSSAGIGALSGIVVAGRLSPRRHAGRLMLGAAAAFSATMLFVANSPSLWLGMGLVVVAHFGNGMFNISALVAVQLRVPDAIRGRVMGVFAISQSIGLLGGLWTGALAAAIGLRAGMMVGPVVLLVLIFTVFATQRKVRELHEDTVLDG